MTPAQRRVLIGLGGAIVAIAAAVGLLALRGRGGSQAVLRTADTSIPPRTTSTIKVIPTTTTTVKPTTAVTGATTPTTVAPKVQALNGDGAVLAVPGGLQVVRTLDPAQGCQTLADAGFTPHCGVVATSAGSLIWMTEEGPGGALRAYVFAPASGTNKWSVALGATDDARARWAAVSVNVADLNGDGHAEMAFGFRDQGSGSILELDLVDGSQTVVVHRSLSHGSARVSNGQLDTWSAEYPNNEPNCCPPTFRHDVIRFNSSVWQIVASSSVDPSTVPPSQFL